MMPSPSLLGLVLLAAGVSGRVFPRQTATNSTCKATPGTSAWPAPEVWAELNKTTEGRLLQPAPPGAVCFQNQPTYNAAKCYQVQLQWGDEMFHTNHPTSVEWNNWTNDTCLPNPLAGLTCSGIGYPIYVINATTPQHVKAGIDFGKSLMLLRSMHG